MTPRSVSVVVNTYNRAESLARTLEALEWLDYPRFEVVVVNGPSTDGTSELLESYGDRIKVGTCEDRNLSESRNIGVRMAAGEIVAFIDDDAYPDPGWLDALDAAYDDDEVAAAGGPTFDHTGYSLQALYSRVDRFCNASVELPPAANKTRYLSFPGSMEFLYTIGTNSSFRRDRLVAIGGFDEEYAYYAEEADACCRLIDAGFVVAALDEGFVYHKFLPSEMRRRSDVVNDWFQVLKSTFYFTLKHGVAATSFADACASATEFVEGIRERVLKDLEAGNLDQSDADRFESDVCEASDLALARYVAGAGSERQPDWFDTTKAPFTPYPTRRPRGAKLHVCLLCQECPPDPVNGIGRAVHTLARSLAARGHVVRVVTRGADHHRVDFEDGVWVHRIVTSSHARPVSPAVPAHVWDLAASHLDELERIHTMRPIDVVQAPNWDSEGIATLLDGRFPLVVGLYTPLATLVRVDLERRGNADEPVIRQLLELERYAYEHADAFLASTGAIVEEIKAEYGVHLPADRTGTILLGLTDRAREGGSGADTPSGRHAGPTRFLFVGRLEARKGIDLLLDAVALLSDRGLDFTLTVAGDDTMELPDGETARAAFTRRWPEHAGRVRFLGRVDDQELWHLYEESDVVVAPSRYESFGLMILEAMMFAKPVICSDVGGMRKVLDDGTTGLLVPVDDVESLADAMFKLAVDPGRRLVLGANGRAVFEERFSAEAMARDVEEFYTGLVGERTHREVGV